MKQKKGYLLTIGSAIGFGTQPLFASLLYAYEIGDTMLALLRVLCMVPFFFVLVCILKNESFSITLKQFLKIAFLALTGSALTTSMLFTAYCCIDTGTATTLHFTYPVVVIALGTVIYHEKLTRHVLVCFVLCMLGIAAFCNPAGSFTWKGSALAICSGITYAIYVLYLDKSRILHEMGFFSYSFYFSLLSSLTMLPIVALNRQLSFEFSHSAWPFVVLLSGVCGSLSTVLAQMGICEIGSRRASVLSTLEAVTSIVLGIVFMGEAATPLQVSGIVLILASAIYLALDRPAWFV